MTLLALLKLLMPAVGIVSLTLEVGLCAGGLGASSASNVIPISPIATILNNSFISVLLCTESLPGSELWKEEAGGVEAKGFAEQNPHELEMNTILYSPVSS